MQIDKATLTEKLKAKELWCFAWGGQWHIVMNVPGRGFVAACDTTKSLMDRGVVPASPQPTWKGKRCDCAACDLRFIRADKGMADFNSFSDYEAELEAVVDEDLASGKVPHPRVHTRQTRGV